MNDFNYLVITESPEYQESTYCFYSKDIAYDFYRVRKSEGYRVRIFRIREVNMD